MQNESHKLPYVFVELDEIENPKPLKEYDGYHQAVAPEEGFADFPRNPYYPVAGPLPPISVTPFPQPMPMRQQPPTMFPGRPPMQGAPMPFMPPGPQELQGRFPADDPFDDDDLDFDLDDRENEIPAKDEKGEEGPLNLETVVVPVFKSVDASGGPVPLQAPQKMPTQVASPQRRVPQPSYGRSIPFFRAMPYTYNPFRAPFVGPIWPNFGMYPFLGGSFHPAAADGTAGAGSGTPQPSPLRARTDAGSDIKPNGRVSTLAHSRSERTNRVDARSDASPMLPAEAREALSASSRQPSRSSRSAMVPSISMPALDKVPEPITVEPLEATSESRTIKASSDSISVEVVIPGKANGAGTQAAAHPAPMQKPASSTHAPEQAALSASQSSVPVSKGSKHRKRVDGPKKQKETFEEQAMRENAEKTHTSLVETNDVNDVGKPLLDSNAIANSEMFSKPADSMNENLTGFQFRSSRRKHVLVIILVAVVLALVVAAIASVFAVWSQFHLQ